MESARFFVMLTVGGNLVCKLLQSLLCIKVIVLHA